MPLGPKTKYTPALIESAREYLDGGYEDEGGVFPSIAGLALHCGVHRDTLYTWDADDDKPEISDILAKTLLKQEILLLNKGLKGEYNAALAKLCLGKHGYSDKTETNNKHFHDFGETSDEELDRIIASEQGR